MRICWTVFYADARSVIMKDRGGEIVSLARVPNLPTSQFYRIKLSHMQKGSFIDTATMPQTDGAQKALEAPVLSEAARSTSERHLPWDLQPQNTITDATVADRAAAQALVRGGQQLKGSEKTVIVPPNVPVVTFKPATDALLTPGIKVLANAQERDGTPTAFA